MAAKCSALNIEFILCPQMPSEYGRGDGKNLRAGGWGKGL